MVCFGTLQLNWRRPFLSWADFQRVRARAGGSTDLGEHLPPSIRLTQFFSEIAEPFAFEGSFGELFLIPFPREAIIPMLVSLVCVRGSMTSVRFASEQVSFRLTHWWRSIIVCAVRRIRGALRGRKSLESPSVENRDHLSPDERKETAPPESNSSGEKRRIFFETKSLAEVYAQQGNVSVALEIYRRVQKQTPSDQQAGQRVSELEGRLRSRRSPKPKGQDE